MCMLQRAGDKNTLEFPKHPHHKLLQRLFDTWDFQLLRGGGGLEFSSVGTQLPYSCTNITHFVFGMQKYF